jgi:hypothetical protein
VVNSILGAEHSLHMPSKLPQVSYRPHLRFSLSNVVTVLLLKTLCSLILEGGLYITGSKPSSTYSFRTVTGFVSTTFQDLFQCCCDCLTAQNIVEPDPRGWSIQYQGQGIHYIYTLDCHRFSINHPLGSLSVLL